jgi:hypothetical protein
MDKNTPLDHSETCRARIGRVWIKIADLTIALVSDHPALQLGVEGAMRKFLVHETAPDVSVRAVWGDVPDDPGGEIVFDSGGLWRLYRQDETYRFRFASPAVGPLPYKIAGFDSSFCRGEVRLQRRYFNCERPIYPLEYPLDELLMINLLAGGKGVELHACAVIDSAGNGHLFTGQSGAGKTTIARLWEQERGAQVLSDDRIILRRLGGKLWLYGTPWHGEAKLSCPTRVPLTHVYFLRHGQQNELITQPAAEALGRLFTCSFPPFYNRQALDFTLDFLAQVVAAVPCDELRFLPDRRVLACIRQQTG